MDELAKKSSAERDLAIARAVYQQGFDDGLADVPRVGFISNTDADLLAIIAQVDASLGLKPGQAEIEVKMADLPRYQPYFPSQRVDASLGGEVATSDRHAPAPVLDRAAEECPGAAPTGSTGKHPESRSAQAAEPPSDLDRMAAALREQWYAQQGGEPYPWEKVAEIHRAGWRAVAAHVMDLLKREDSLGGVRESDPIQVDNAAIPGAGRNKTIGPSAFSPAQAAEPPSLELATLHAASGALTFWHKTGIFHRCDECVEHGQAMERQRAAGILFRVANTDWDEDGVCWCAPEHQRPNKHVSYCEAAKAYLAEAEAAQKGEG